MKRRFLLVPLSIALLALVSCGAQRVDEPTDFRAVEYNEIKGAQKLGQPYFLRNVEGNPIFVKKNGMAYPTLIDWTGDGKDDLLIGEFGDGALSNVQVFKNFGEKKNPVYARSGYYATDINKEKFSVLGSLCLGFYPQAVDLNGDGVTDIVSGSYLGKIIMYAGLKKGGFAPGVEIERVIDETGERNPFDYMLANTTFADYNNDGLLDAFVGGGKRVRVMLNIGTKNKPKFGEPLYLVDTDFQELSITSDATDKNYHIVENQVFAIYIDWDRDGVNDLITTSSYFQYGSEPILFHKGVDSALGKRFEKPVALLKQEGEIKAIPGANFVPYICDYDNDGALDILLGVTFDYHTKEKRIMIEEAYNYSFTKELLDRQKDLRVKELEALKNIDYPELTAGYQRESAEFDETINNITRKRENIYPQGYIIVFPGLKR